MKTDISIGRVSSLLVWCGNSHHGGKKIKSIKGKQLTDKEIEYQMLLAKGNHPAQILKP